MSLLTRTVSLTKKLSITLIAVLVVATSAFMGTAAHALPDPNAQGGADGVIFFTEATDGAIYVGDFKTSPTAKSVFW